MRPWRLARAFVMPAIVVGGTWVAQGQPAAAAELSASAVANLNGYTLTYSGSNFPSGANVEIILSGVAGLAPFSLGGETAGIEGSFYGLVTLRCVPVSGVVQQRATVSAVLWPNGPALAAANVSFACLLQR
jgi:hypothetical protein